MRKSALLLLLLAALPLVAQPKEARVSPDQTLKQTVALTDITITYSRPAVKGRKIFGDLVPYGQVWRTGANDATTITFTDDVTINGKPLPKGSYSLHTIPTANEWTIIFNKTAKQWGSFKYDQAQDALRISVKPVAAPFAEWMTFEIPQLTADSATIQIHWDKVAVPFSVGVKGSK